MRRLRLRPHVDRKLAAAEVAGCCCADPAGDRYFHKLLAITVDIQFIPAREISRVMQGLVESTMERFATDSLG